MIDHASGLTDICLCGVSVSLGVHAWRAGHRSGGIGLSLLGVAAGLGALRFSVAPGVSDLHELAIWIVATVGLPLIGIGYLQRVRAVDARVAALVLGVFSALGASPMGHSAYAAGSAALGMLLVLAISVRIGSVTGGAGATAVLVAGLALRPASEALAIPFVPAYHLTLAVASTLLWRGLVSSSGTPDIASNRERTP